MKFIALLTTLALTSLSVSSYAALVVMDRVAVVVDQDVIMQSEIDERMKSIKAQIAADPKTQAPQMTYYRGKSSRDSSLRTSSYKRLIAPASG